MVINMKTVITTLAALVVATPLFASDLQDAVVEAATAKCEAMGKTYTGNAQLMHLGDGTLAMGFSCDNIFYAHQQPTFEVQAQNRFANDAATIESLTADNNRLAAQLNQLAAANDELNNTINQANTDIQAAHDKLYWYINGHGNVGDVVDVVEMLQTILNNTGGHTDPGNVNP